MSSTPDIRLNGNFLAESGEYTPINTDSGENNNNNASRVAQNAINNPMDSTLLNSNDDFDDESRASIVLNAVKNTASSAAHAVKAKASAVVHAAGEKLAPVKNKVVVLGHAAAEGVQNQLKADNDETREEADVTKKLRTLAERIGTDRIPFLVSKGAVRTTFAERSEQRHIENLEEELAELIQDGASTVDIEAKAKEVENAKPGQITQAKRQIKKELKNVVNCIKADLAKGEKDNRILNTGKALLSLNDELSMRVGQGTVYVVTHLLKPFLNEGTRNGVAALIAAPIRAVAFVALSTLNVVIPAAIAAAAALTISAVIGSAVVVVTAAAAALAAATGAVVLAAAIAATAVGITVIMSPAGNLITLGLIICVAYVMLKDKQKNDKGETVTTPTAQPAAQPQVATRVVETSAAEEAAYETFGS